MALNLQTLKAPIPAPSARKTFSKKESLQNIGPAARNELSPEKQKDLDKRLLRIVNSSTNATALGDLLWNGADPNARDRSLNLTALMLAARKGKAEFSSILLDWGADHRLSGHGNATAYEIAKTWEQEEVISLFRKRGLANIPK